MLAHSQAVFTQQRPKIVAGHTRVASGWVAEAEFRFNTTIDDRAAA
jgi:hypothetical protein